MMSQMEKKVKNAVSLANEEAQLQRTKLELQIQKTFTTELTHQKDDFLDQLSNTEDFFKKICSEQEKRQEKVNASL